MTFAELQASSLPAKVRPSFFVLTENSRKINGALVKATSLGTFRHRSCRFRFHWRLPDWTLKKAAQISSFLRQR